MKPLSCIRYLYAGTLDKRPDRTALTNALDGVVKATGLTRVEGLGPTLWLENEQGEGEENPPSQGRYTAIQVVAESHVSISGEAKQAYCQVSSCKAINERSCIEALCRHLPGNWREVRQDSYHEVG